MKRFVLTGAPGAGKTSILRLLAASGLAVVEEAATDLISLALAEGTADPWLRADFLDRIVAEQRRRQLVPGPHGAHGVVHDRSPLCTLALVRHLGRAPSAALTQEIERVGREHVYERRVFFVREIGFCEPTAVRRISYEDSLRFERMHEDVYRAHGHELVEVAPAPVAERAASVAAHLRSWATSA